MKSLKGTIENMSEQLKELPCGALLFQTRYNIQRGFKEEKRGIMLGHPSWLSDNEKRKIHWLVKLAFDGDGITVTWVEPLGIDETVCQWYHCRAFDCRDCQTHFQVSYVAPGEENS